MSVFSRGLARYCPSMHGSGGLIGLAALAPLLWLGIVSPAASESLAASAPDRRAQAPAIAVTDDGSIHAIWFDKGAVGEADKRGRKSKALTIAIKRLLTSTMRAGRPAPRNLRPAPG